MCVCQCSLQCHAVVSSWHALLEAVVSHLIVWLQMYVLWLKERFYYRSSLLNLNPPLLGIACCSLITEY